MPYEVIGIENTHSDIEALAREIEATLNRIHPLDIVSISYAMGGTSTRGALIVFYTPDS